MVASVGSRGPGRSSVPRARDEVPWRLRLFGRWQLHHGDRVIDVAWREQRLLAVLALHGDRPRSHLAGVLWPDSSEERALGNLRAAVWRIQHASPGLIAEGRGPLALDPTLRVDVHDMLDWVRRISAGAEVSDSAPALALLRSGELLPGWYDDWVLFERERLQQLRLRCLESFAERLCARGDIDGALAAAMAAVAIEPLRESAHRALIRVHLAVGNQVDAVRAYQSFRSRLMAEMGIVPSPQITALVRPLLAARIPVARQRPHRRAYRAGWSV